MVTFFSAIVLLLVGHFLYGKLVEKVFRPNERLTPAILNPDGMVFALICFSVYLYRLEKSKNRCNYLINEI